MMTKRIDIDIPSTDKGNDPWDLRNDPEMIPSEPSVLDKLKGWELTSEDEVKAEEGFWLVPGVFWNNHATMVCAPSNGGKTRITFHLMCQLAEDGYDIRYINMDIALSDAANMRRRAIKAGMQFLTPDLKKTSATEVYDALAAIAQSDENLRRVVFVIDNLKQIADVISKREIKDKMQMLCKGLTRTGATIVILAHTNKYTDNKGKPIYEGTVDIHNLVDELIYLESDKTTNGQTVQLLGNKNRLTEKKPPSFQIDLDGNVTELESPVDVRKRKRDRGQLVKDKDGIAAARERLKLSECIQGELVDYVSKEAGIGKNTATKLLKRYIGKPMYWKVETSDNNAKVYTKC